MLPSFLDAHEIHMKNGQVYKTDTYWEKDGEILVEKFGATLYLDKNNIEKIVNQVESQLSDKDKNRLERKYNHQAPIVVLKDGRKFKAKKTWFKDGYIYCKTEDEIFEFTQSQINELILPKVKLIPTSYTRTFNSNRQKQPWSSVLERNFERKKSRCSKCNGTGRIGDWRWGTEIIGHDSYGNPIKKNVQVASGTRNCPLCNGTGFYPP